MQTQQADNLCNYVSPSFFARLIFVLYYYDSKKISEIGNTLGTIYVLLLALTCTSTPKSRMSDTVISMYGCDTTSLCGSNSSVTGVFAYLAL